MKLFTAQFKAESLRIVRSPFFLLFSIAMPMGFYFLFATLNGPDTPVGGTTWGIYSLMSMTTFSLIGTAVSQFGIRLCYERKEGWTRQLALTPLSHFTWISAKIASQLMVHLLTIVVLFPLAAVVYDLKLSVYQWVASSAWLIAGSVVFLAVGALVGTMRNTDAATIVSNIVFMGMAITGGLWMPLESLPGWMQTVGRWMPSHLYASGAWDISAGESISLTNLAILAVMGASFVVLSNYILTKREAV